MKPVNQLTREQSRALLAATAKGAIRLCEDSGMTLAEAVRHASAVNAAQTPAEQPKTAPGQPRPAKRKKSLDIPFRSESAEQQAVIRWWATAHLSYSLPEHLLFAVPLQAARTARNGARMKSEGARVGTPDMFLLAARGAFHGAAIEMKRGKSHGKPGGKLSDEQREFLADLTAQGYYTAVCYSADDAITTIQNYLSI